MEIRQIRVIRVLFLTRIAKNPILMHNGIRSIRPAESQPMSQSSPVIQVDHLRKAEALTGRLT